MTDETETTSDDMTDDDTETTNPLDLLPVGDTDVFAETAEIDDDTDHGTDVAEEVEAMSIVEESDADAAAEASDTDDAAADTEVDAAAEGSASDEADEARGGSEADDEPESITTTPRCVRASGTSCTRSRATRRRSRPTSRPESSR